MNKPILLLGMVLIIPVLIASTAAYGQNFQADDEQSIGKNTFPNSKLRQHRGSTLMAKPVQSAFERFKQATRDLECDDEPIAFEWRPKKLASCMQF